MYTYIHTLLKSCTYHFLSYLGMTLEPTLLEYSGSCIEQNNDNINDILQNIEEEQLIRFITYLANVTVPRYV